jgi:hypothetical protein
MPPETQASTKHTPALPTPREYLEADVLRRACDAAVNALRDGVKQQELTAEQAALEVVKAYRAAERELSDSAPGARPA